ncbi:hypothetical protein CW304_17860 [Bacillus sp. UFRGS-B20]|nr:hypothetical protein CW304_17860 [Bacillus sp. UFRGS-B20]
MSTVFLLLHLSDDLIWFSQGEISRSIVSTYRLLTNSLKFLFIIICLCFSFAKTLLIIPWLRRILRKRVNVQHYVAYLLQILPGNRNKRLLYFSLLFCVKCK